jgi:hypothetical protein
VTVLTKRVGRAAPREETMDGVRVVRVAPSGDRTAAQKWLMLPAIAWSMVRLRRTYDLVYSPDYRGIGIAGIVVARLLRRPSAMGTAALGVINGANLDPALTRIGMNPRGAGTRIVKSTLRRIYSAADAFPPSRAPFSRRRSMQASRSSAPRTSRTVWIRAGFVLPPTANVRPCARTWDGRSNR